MCGICGYWSARRQIPEGLLVEMRDAMRHRGPDGAGLWVRPDGHLGLAHRRLAILDLSSAAGQPMLSQDGRIVLTFNGEIYNHAALRAELRSLGRSFHTASDTEVLLQAYLAWGTACLERLEGMFAFALYDAARGCLFLARDRVGEKPLFYRHDGSSFAFASELKALVRDPSFSRIVDPDALDRYLAYGYVPGDGCIYANARKLPAAHALEYDLSTGLLRVWRYWQLPVFTQAAGAPPDELLEEAERLLEGAVHRQLVADVSVGVLLSGGLDSSLVTAFAAAVSPTPVKTFTITFPGHGAYDEAPYARLVASHFGTQHTELAAEDATVDLLPALARQFDEPLADSSMLPMYLVSKLIRPHATVALGGDGGDELFGGYPHHGWVQRQAQLRAVVPAPLRAVAASVGQYLPVGTRGRNHLLGVAGETGRSIAHVNLYFDAATRRRLLRPVMASGAACGGAEMERASLGRDGSTPLQQMTRADFRGYLPDDLLVKVDRASMLTSLEVRAPFLDRRLVEFAFGRLPDALRATVSQRKVLLRRLAARRLPATLDLRRKQGFSIPLASWFRGPWGEALKSIVLSAPATLFDRPTIDSLLTGQERGHANAQRLFALAFFELWRREYRAELPC